MIVLGRDIESKVEIELPAATRAAGMYVIGRRGMGKSTLLESLIAEDIDAGHGVGVLDPHGALVEAVLRRIPDYRADDVVLLDVSDPDYSFGLNLFEVPEGADRLTISQIVDSVVQTFKKVWGVGEDASWGPLLEDLLSNITHTLVANPGSTLAEVPALLYKPQYRAQMLASVDNWVVRDFWEYEWDPLGTNSNSRQQILDRRSTTNKVRAFLRDPILLHVLGQRETTVDFRGAMDTEKILLVKLPSGPKVSDTAISLLGSLIVGQLLTAAMGRDADSPLFSLYADEFQRFATPAFATLIDETRKYRVSTTVAHQRRDQLDWSYRNAALGAVNFAIFQVTGEDADEMASQFELIPEPGEPIAKQKMEPVYETRTVEIWDPPESEARYKRHLAEWHHAHRHVVILKLAIGLEAPRPWDEVRELLSKEYLPWLLESAAWRSRFEHGDKTKDVGLALYEESAQYLRDLHETQEWKSDDSFLWYKEKWKYWHRENERLAALCNELLTHKQGTREEQIYLYDRPVKRTVGSNRWGDDEEEVEYEYVPGPPRPLSDIRTELANRLATLPPYTVALRFFDGTQYRQHIVRLTPPEPIEENLGVIDCIIQESRARYCRPRDEVEREIVERRRRLDDEPDEPESPLGDNPPEDDGPPIVRRLH